MFVIPVLSSILAIVTVLYGGGLWWWSRTAATGPHIRLGPVSDGDDAMTALVDSTPRAVHAGASFAVQETAQLRPAGETSQKSKLMPVQPTQATPHGAELCPSNPTNIESFECPATDVLDKLLATFNTSRINLELIAREKGQVTF